MRWTNLEVALAIERGGSLTRAGMTLGIDQSTIGRRLSAMERELGARLFIRSKNGLAVTDRGKIVVEHAKAIEREIEAMQDQLSNSDEEITGTVRLFSNPWILRQLAGAKLKEFLGQYPNIHIRMSSRLPPNPVQGDVTLSLWFDAPPLEVETATPFCTVPYAVYGSHQFLDPDPSWVEFRDDGAFGPSFSSRLQKQLGKNRKVALTATDASILKSAIASGAGLGVLPVCLGDPDPNLTRQKGYELNMERQLKMYINPDFQQFRRVQVVMEWLESCKPLLISGEVFA